jgi:DNA adenine methylase
MRYHGGKWRLAPWIIRHFPAHGRYVEPFGGSASVLLRKDSSAQEVYNDLDGEIVNVFRVLRKPNQAARLAHLRGLTQHSRAEFELGWEPISPQDDPVEAARRTMTRAYMGYGNSATGKYKTGFRSRHDVGGGNLAASWAEYPEQISAFTRRLRSVTLECMDAAECIAKYDDAGTLFYVDPTYLPETRTAHAGGYRHEMTPEQHRQLADVLLRVRGMVVLSGYDSPMYRELYAGWRVTTCAARGEKAASRTEFLWISPRASRCSSQGLLEGAV